MRIYQVITTGHLISAMLLQEEYSGDSVLVCPEWICMKYPNYEQLSRFFGRVLILRTGFRHSHSKEETKKYFFDNLPELSHSGVDIYVWGAQSGLGILCAEEDIPFIFCEEGTGFLSRPEVLSHHDARNPDLIDNYEFLCNLGLYDGNCKMAKSLLGNVKAQNIGFEPPEGKEIIDFSISERLDELSEGSRQEIIGFFMPDKKKYEIKENSTVIFTQHFANLFAMSLEEQAHLYQVFVDYICSDSNLIIKPHPDDLLYYSELFPDAFIIHDRFPSEFIPYVCMPAPKRYATVYSSAIYNMIGQDAEITELSLDYERNYIYSNRYYVTAFLASRHDSTIYTLGVDKSLFEEILNRNFADMPLRREVRELEELDIKSTGEKVLVLDDCGDDSQFEFLRNNKDIINCFNLILFINSKRRYIWTSEWLNLGWSNIIAIPIKKERLKNKPDEDFFENMMEEVIYMWTLSEEERRKAMNTEVRKTLPHVGVELKKIPVEDSEEKILMLEGMLEATENALLFYRNKVREYQEK